MILQSNGAPASEWLDDTLGVLRDGANVGVLRDGEQALLIDCGSGAVLERLPLLGIGIVAWVLATHHHRDTCSGLPRCRAQGARLAVSAEERHLFEAVERHWQAPTSLFHRYRLRPGTNVLPRSVAVDQALADGDVFPWRYHAIHVVGTPGHTDGSLSYVIDHGNDRVAFVGDLLYDGGRFWELWSLQGPLPDDPVGSQDYHAFCGRGRQAVRSLERLLAQYAPTVLIPAHGPVIRDPGAALGVLRDSLEALLANYYRTSAMRYYFGEWATRQMGTAPQVLPGQFATPPTWYRVIRGTTRAIIAPSGRALLFDSAGPAVAEHVVSLVASGAIAGVDAVWISHYHDDHVGGIAALTAQTGCAVWAHRGLVDILEHPDAYCMPGLDPTEIAVDRVLEEGQLLTWEGFTLSAYDFPGQAIHHSALFIEYAGTTLLIAGDSFTPGGLDDYCSHNRNLLGAGRGYDRCLDVLEQLQPDLLVNMHVTLPFVLPATFRAEARVALRERERLLQRLLPWEHPNFGLDPQWSRAYPYRQTLAAGANGTLTLQFSNYATSTLHVHCVLTSPAGWTVQQPTAEQIAPGTDGALVASFVVPPDTAAGRYILTADVSVNGRAFGAWVDALVDIGDN